MATKGIKLQPLSETTLRMTLVGDSDLILNKKSRSFELQEIYKQSHPKGTKIPDVLCQPYNLFEKLITGITWENPIEYHDEDYSLYTEEEWSKYMTENKPCILNKALTDSFKEVFITFFKDATGKNGSDFARAININSVKNPIKFAQAGYSQHLTPNNSVSHTNVLAQYNVFNGWSCDIDVTFVDAVFPTETIVDIISKAGRYIGIGTKRKEGSGRYHIDNIQVIK